MSTRRWMNEHGRVGMMRTRWMDGHRRNRMKTLRWTNAHTGGSDEGSDTDECAHTDEIG
jgi:hypothetical protein